MSDSISVFSWPTRLSETIIRSRPFTHRLPFDFTQLHGAQSAATSIAPPDGEAKEN
jgi:hypothetical protein